MLAGGAGSRMRPLTDTCPKPLLPLGAEPLIGYQLRRLAAAGVSRVVVSTGYLADHFGDVLGDGSTWGVDLRFCAEAQPLGTGGAMRAAVEHLPGADRVIVLNGDLLSSHSLPGQLAATGRAQACLHVRGVRDVAPYGQVRCDDEGWVHGFAEKTGAGPGLINAGTYVVQADLLRTLPVGPASWERDVLPSLIAGGALIRAWPDAGYFRDVGSPAAYRLASVDAVTGVLPGGDPAQAYVAAGAVVAAGARVTGGSSVQSGAVVETGAVVDASVVLAGATIGRGVRVTRCVVARDVRISSGATHEDQTLTG